MASRKSNTNGQRNWRCVKSIDGMTYSHNSWHRTMEEVVARRNTILAQGIPATFCPRSRPIPKLDLARTPQPNKKLVAPSEEALSQAVA